MQLYQISRKESKLVAVKLDIGFVDFTKALRLFSSLKKDLHMVKLTSLKELISLSAFSEDMFYRVFDFLEAHNLWQDVLINEPFKILPPIENPGKIIAIGLNYAAHAHEGGRDVPSEPIFFAKAPSVVIGHEDFIEILPGIGRVDHELELAVVIGKKGKNIPEEYAKDFVAGYTIFNDVTARELQRRAKTRQEPWFHSKNFDTFGPMGPCLVTRDSIPSPVSLDMELRVNGEVRQAANTSQMVFSIPRLIHFISRSLTLYPGDVISTGTPEGISELHDKDVVEAEIEKIGILRNPVKVLKEGKDLGFRD